MSIGIGEYSGQSIKLENLATCFKALVGIIEPKNVVFAEEYFSEEKTYGVDKITERLERLKSFRQELIFVFGINKKNKIQVSLFKRYGLILLSVSNAGDKLEQNIINLIVKYLELKEPTDADLRSDASEENIYNLLWNVFDEMQYVKDEIITIKQKITEAVALFKEKKK